MIMDRIRCDFSAGFSAVRTILIGVSIFVFCFVIAACSIREKAEDATDSIARTTNKIVREITFAGDGLKKVIAVVRFEDTSLQAHEKFMDTFHEDIMAYLKVNCEELIVTDSGALTQLPKLASGQTDNYALAIIGRQLGVTAVIAGNLNNIRPKNEEQGILWAKDTHYSIEISIRTEIYDTQTATKTLDERFAESVEIDEIQYRVIQEEGVYSEPQIQEALDRLVSEMSDRICETLDEQNWHGYVTAIKAEKITVSTGGPVGLEPGDILEVFESGQVLEGLDGQRFISPGLKKADIEIVAVSEKEAEAAASPGHAIKTGFIVRKK